MINLKETKKEFLSLLLDSDIKTVLDLGCGKGLMSRFFSRKNVRVPARNLTALAVR